MANGYWGSRLPIGNFLCSRFIVTALRWRLFTCRVKNAVRRFIHPGRECVQNDQRTRETLECWFREGYDKLNIGGGSKNLEGFVNLDFVFFPAVKRQVVANILDLSFVPESSVSHLHSNHVLEHLTPEELANHLHECHRVLKPEGMLTARCPNALGAAYAFWFGAVIEQERDEFVAGGFPADEDFGNPKDNWIERDLYGLMHWLYGDVGNVRNQHLNRITPSMLAGSLQQAGFTIVKMTRPEAINIAVVARKAQRC